MAGTKYYLMGPPWGIDLMTNHSMRGCSTIELELEWELAQWVEHLSEVLTMQGRTTLVDLFSDRGFYLFHPMLHDWYIKDYGMYCPVCGKSAYKRSLAANGKNVAGFFTKLLMFLVIKSICSSCVIKQNQLLTSFNWC